MDDVRRPPSGQFLREEFIRGGMDLLLFVNTCHLRRADEKLASLALGRAHHRVLYFVGRNPGLRVSDLLDLLGVKKQSLARVNQNLTERGLLEMRPGERDRRERLLDLTPAGAQLEKELFDELHDNMLRAYSASGGEAVQGFWIVLQHLIGEKGRAQFEIMQEAAQRSPNVG